MSLHIIILAAGAGKRMFSELPKVLHPIGGKPMLARIVEVAELLEPDMIHIVYGHGGEQIKSHLAGLSVNWVFQEEQLGTGHAVQQALPNIPTWSDVLILSGDVPLIQLATLRALLDTLADEKNHALALLVAKLDNPAGLGRILRDQQGSVCAIVEEKDASPEEKQLKEIYSGICCAKASELTRWLSQLTNHNAQAEYYLTDIIALAVAENKSIASLCADDVAEIQGVNNKLQLQQLERLWQRREAEKRLLEGIFIADTGRIDVRGELHCGQDVFIDVNCVFIGKVILGNHCHIEPNCILKEVVLGDGCHIFANSVIDGAELGNHCDIGPFARLRPGTKLSANCKIGNFVETKNAQFGEHSKASHLSYLGDVSIGREVNIGAGTITCNYDGCNKHHTTIEDGVFIGSDTQLVAPVTVGANATIGAGSTIRKNAPPNELTLTASQQKTIFGWKRPTKNFK